MSEKFVKAEQASTNQNKKMDSLINKLDTYETNLFDVIVVTSKLESENIKLREDNTMMKAQINQIDARTRSSNLRFFNIPEDSTKTPIENLREYIKSDLKVNEVNLDSARKIVTKVASLSTKHSHIIGRFRSTHDATIVRSAAFSRPKGSKGSVEEDLPQDWAQTRKDAQPDCIVHLL